VLCSGNKFVPHNILRLSHNTLCGTVSLMRRVLGVLLSLPFLAFGTWLGYQFVASKRPVRAVAVVVIDTLRADAALQPTLGGLPNPWADFSSHACANYDRAYSSAGWTLPSVASLLTGVDPEVHHAHGKATLLAPISPDLTTLAESFRDQGFRTVAVTNAAFLNPLLGVDRGFDVYDHEHAYNRSGRRADESVDRAIRYIEAAGREDLFLFVHVFDPHLDYDPLDGSGDGAGPVTLSELRDLQAKGGPTPSELQRVRSMYDREAGAALRAAHRLYDHYVQSDRYHELTFVLTADHGEEFDEHGDFEHGHTLHTELVHVPLLISAERIRPGGMRCDGVVSTRDLGRLLLESLELEVPATFASSTSDWKGTGGGTAYSATTLYGPDRIALRTDTHAGMLELHVDEQSTGALYDIAVDPDEQNPLPIDPEFTRALLDRRRANRKAGELTRRLDWQDLGPSKHAERDATLKSLESLGYTGSDRDDGE